jgi:NhaP-type Na+/H+ or K+/H+ antiporter
VSIVGTAIGPWQPLLSRVRENSTIRRARSPSVAHALRCLSAAEAVAPGVLAAVARVYPRQALRHGRRTRPGPRRGRRWSRVERLVFVLIGLQLPRIVAELRDRPPEMLIALAAMVCLAVIGVRFIWVFASDLPRLRRDRDAWREDVVLSWAAMRGVVSLAAALALPLTTSTGEVLPGRDLLIFVTFCVILVTLVGQGLTLPWVLRRLHLHADGAEEHEEAFAREPPPRPRVSNQQPADEARARAVDRHVATVYDTFPATWPSTRMAPTAILSVRRGGARADRAPRDPPRCDRSRARRHPRAARHRNQ